MIDRIFKRKQDPRLAEYEQVRIGFHQANTKLDQLLESIRRLLDEREGKTATGGK